MRKVQTWFVVVLVGLLGEIVMALVLAGINLFIGRALTDIEANMFVSNATLDLVESLELSLWSIWLGFTAFGITATVGLMGFLFQLAKITVEFTDQLADNLPKGRFRFSPGWAIGGWFIPIVAIFVIPLFISDQLEALKATGKSLLTFLSWFYLPILLVASRGLLATGRLYEEAETLGDFVFVFYADSALAFGYAISACLIGAIALALRNGLRSWLRASGNSSTPIMGDPV